MKIELDEDECIWRGAELEDKEFWDWRSPYGVGEDQMRKFARKDRDHTK
jgi:hypothetical protein